MARDDILVSVCIHDIVPDPQGTGRLEALAVSLSDAFRYSEILIAVPADAGGDWANAFRSVSNLRLLRLRQGLGMYGMRVALASEAIGDVVLLASAEEIEFLDLPQMIVDAHRKNAIVIGDRGRGSPLDVLLSMAGNSSGFRVNARYMQSQALPRALLTRLLNQPERQVALRFPPRNSSILVEMQRADSRFTARARRRGLSGRLYLAQRLIVSTAPNVLLAMSALSFLTALGSLCYFFYVIMVWLFHDAVQPGWLTTSSFLALTGTLMGLMGFGTSIGIQKIMDLLAGEDADNVLEEIGRINIYAGINEDLNVHYERGTEPSALENRQKDSA